MFEDPNLVVAKLVRVFGALGIRSDACPMPGHG